MNTAATFAPSTGHRQAWPEWLKVWVTPLLVLLAGSWGLHQLGADLTFQRLVFSSEGGWVHGGRFPWSVLYHLGTVPAMLAVLTAMGGLVLKMGRRLPDERNFATAYLALVLAVGPGLLANAVLKDHWGRPRPRDVKEFGGRHAYEPPLVRDAASTGKSFPCGHATMGFFFFAHFFIHRRRHARLAWLALVGALVLGWLIGVARAVQGGHFLTDTWWAMGLMWFTCAGLWAFTSHLERQHWFDTGFRWLRRHPRMGAAALCVVVILAALGALLATPYQRSQVVTGPEIPAAGKLRLSGTFQEGGLQLVEAAQPTLRVEGNGHGMIWSKVFSGVRLKSSREEPEVRYVQTRKGWFTELNQTMRLEFPLSRASGAWMALAETEVSLNLADVVGGTEWRFSGRGGVNIEVPEATVVMVEGGPGLRVEDGTQGGALGAPGGAGKAVGLDLTRFAGTLRLLRPESGAGR